MHDMHVLPSAYERVPAHVQTQAQTHTHSLSQCGDGVCPEGCCPAVRAGRHFFVTVVLLFHIKQNGTALHRAPLISASVPRPFIIASHPLPPQPSTHSLIAPLHQAVLLGMIQASPGYS